MLKWRKIIVFLLVSVLTAALFEGAAGSDAVKAQEGADLQIKGSEKEKPFEVTLTPGFDANQMVKGEKNPFSLTIKNLTGETFNEVNYIIELYWSAEGEVIGAGYPVAAGFIDGIKIPDGSEDFWYEIYNMKAGGTIHATGYIIPPKDVGESENGKYSIRVSVWLPEDANTGSVDSEVTVKLVDQASVVKPVVKVSSISLSALSNKAAAGKKMLLTAAVAPSNAANKALTWKSSNTKFATVDASGKVPSKKPGQGNPSRLPQRQQMEAENPRA